MSKFKDRRDVKEAVANEGLAYFLQGYTGADSMPDAELSAAFEAARGALNNFEALLAAEPAGAGEHRASFNVWSPDDVWDYRDVQKLAGQLDMRQHYVKTDIPTIIKFKKMVDDEILMTLDKVMYLGRNWQDVCYSPTEPLEPPGTKGQPWYKTVIGEAGRVKRICSVKYEFDIDEMRMPDNKAKFPTPFEAAVAMTGAIHPPDSGLSTSCRPDSRGFYYVSNVECQIKVDAYMVEMILYMYAVDFVAKEVKP